MPAKGDLVHSGPTISGVSRPLQRMGMGPGYLDSALNSRQD